MFSASYNPAVWKIDRGLQEGYVNQTTTAENEIWSSGLRGYKGPLVGFIDNGHSKELSSRALWLVELRSSLCIF